ncbi:MAG: hypothetical protein V1660_03135 [archaeon]
MNNKIYLAGSFFDFRDRIISQLSGYEFSDPRKHRQHAISATVEDDMKEAQECPIVLACFPAGKTKGTMTYAEIGASKINGNYLIVADETDEPDNLLDSVSDIKVSSIDHAIRLIKSNTEFKSKQNKIEKKENRGLKVLIATNNNFYQEAKRLNSDRKTIVNINNIKKLEDLADIGLTVVNFPKGEKRDKKSIFFMGASYSLKIPVIMIDENPIIYPPLAGLSRRIFTKSNVALDYLENINSQEIDNEAKLMYDLFKKYKS